MPDEADDGDSTDRHRMTATRLGAASLFLESKIDISIIPVPFPVRFSAFINVINRRIGLPLKGGLYTL